MSEDQIYELIKMIMTTIVSVFGGYQWAKSKIKINISQTQFNEQKTPLM
jgi:hypothetical protein